MVRTRFEEVRVCTSGEIGYSSLRTQVRADVAQLVEHHLAKVRVAGSNPVVRSRGSVCPCGGVAEWLRQGPAKPCTRVRFPSPPPSGRRVTSAPMDTLGQDLDRA